MEKNPLSFNEIVMGSSDKATSDKISRMVKEGKLLKIAPKIYTSNLNDTPERIIKRNVFYILGKLAQFKSSVGGCDCQLTKIWCTDGEDVA